MNWDAIGAIAELLGAIGVIATLAFLAFQIRQNSRLLESQTHQLEQGHRLATAEALGQANSQQDAMIAIAQSDDLSSVLFQGLRDYENLSPEERMRFALAIGPLVGGVAAQTERQLQLELNDGQIRPEELVFVMDFIDTPGGRAWWIRYRNRYPERFRAAVDRALGSEGENE